MFESAVIAQIIVEPNAPVVGNTAVVFNGAQFFTALISGVVLAFAFQLLLTNLGVAALVSNLGTSSDRDDNRDSDSFGTTIKKISVKLGLATLITVTIALFIACMLAVRLGLFVSPVTGAIVGLTIWATFFSLMVWLSSTTVGSLIGSVANTATSGLQALVGTATAAFGARTASKQVVSTAEAAASAVKRELGLAIDPMALRDKVEEYLEALKPPELDVNTIAADFERLLEEENLQDIADSESLRNIDRQTFINLISNRTDLSNKDLNRIADKLEKVWRKRTSKMPNTKSGVTGLMDYLKSATKEQLLGKEFSNKLDTLIEEVRQNRQPSNTGSGMGGAAGGLTVGLNSLVGLIMGRSDLSDFDVDKILSQIEGLKGKLGEQTDKVAAKAGVKSPEPPSRVKADIEHYLLHAKTWQLTQENLGREFREVLYDPEADPEAVATELRQINRSDFVAILLQKGLYTQEKAKAIAASLDNIRLEVLAVADAAIEREKAIATLADVENYLLSTPKEALTSQQIQLSFKPILQDTDADYEQLSERLAQFDRPTFERIFAKRRDVSTIEASAIISELELVKERVLQEALEEQQTAQIKLEAQWLKIYSYLKEAKTEQLKPQNLTKELTFLEDIAQSSTSKMRRALFDRETLVQSLRQRNDVTPEQIDPIVDEIEKIWNAERPASPKLVAKAQEQYDRATSTIAEYLRNTGKTELNPEGIKRDLTLLLEDPKTGFKAIRSRLASMDRDTLVKLLSQREDLSEEQINQTVDEVQATLQRVAKAPRRLARRTQERVQTFQDAIGEYLRSTDKEELNPEGIQRDLQLLLNDPRAGLGSLQERLSHFDRATLVALLSQRQDISEEDANRIIDQILVVREQTLQQLQSIQEKLQTTLDRVLAKIRDYLNSLERPELNYEGISRDLRVLFDDPKAGFEALRDRFSHFDRETLMAILTSRDDISRADIDRIVDRVERTRDRFLQRAERIQQEAKMRVEEVKHEAKKQAEETRKAAAIASWWLFFTALISALASAGAGAIGAVGS
ncbi:MAG: MFS transporter [Hydrococcus sp. Prado102]|jgi:hypothetical protein|nr:MFS transporter [Hydrococcus sp. Prado102]